jgi:hypothetical protein
MKNCALHCLLFFKFRNYDLSVFFKKISHIHESLKSSLALFAINLTLCVVFKVVIKGAFMEVTVVSHVQRTAKITYVISSMDPVLAACPDGQEPHVTIVSTTSSIPFSEFHRYKKRIR